MPEFRLGRFAPRGPSKLANYSAEHSTSDRAGCQQAACKRFGIKIPKGELRIGTYVQNFQSEEWMTIWRHWRCATPHQIKRLKELTGDKPEDTPGFAGISPESQEHVRQAFEDGKVKDKDISDIRTDLAKSSYGGLGGAAEIRNAVGYIVEVASQGRGGCRGADCKKNGVKIAKGELRLGIATNWDEDHVTWVWKHWKCVSPFDLSNAKEIAEDEEVLTGLDLLPEEYSACVLNSLEQGQAIEPPVIEAPPKPKNSKTRRRPKKDKNTDTKTTEETFNDDDGVADVAKTLARKRKKRTVEEVTTTDDDEKPGPERKKRRASKAAPKPVQGVDALSEAPKTTNKAKVEEVDPATARILAMTNQLRADAARSPPKRGSQS
ncbi:zf-PARP-domain-containing protein [Polyplosphaeria fusca]|uniref:Zf-PARP-domain-containing protein n=1 Tax=Polyplosphaeria fusca TaxID=682080 RepID=A0A9P4QR99_9PLEO|nr:zf-PARP-domain-containing protein [Polyplosphaeria fusca]